MKKIGIALLFIGTALLPNMTLAAASKLSSCPAYNDIIWKATPTENEGGLILWIGSFKGFSTIKVYSSSTQEPTLKSTPHPQWEEEDNRWICNYSGATSNDQSFSWSIHPKS